MAAHFKTAVPYQPASLALPVEDLTAALPFYHNARKTPCFSYGDISVASFLRRSPSVLFLGIIEA